jgi:hypothetical protein
MWLWLVRPWFVHRGCIPGGAELCREGFLPGFHHGERIARHLRRRLIGGGHRHLRHDRGQTGQLLSNHRIGCQCR